MSTMSVDATTADGIGTLILDHPPLNILTRSVLAELRGRLAELAVDAENGRLRALLLVAAGKHFSAGADVGEHLPPEFEVMIPEFLDTIEAMLGAGPGLCAGCLHAKLNVTRRGTAYLRCLRASWDARLVRYPRLPVPSCPGFEPATGTRGASDGGPVTPER